MASYNKIILVGNVTRDPKLSYLPSQTAVVELGLAVNHKWRGQDGQQRESTCFIDCRAYGNQAETLNQYVRKGNPILIEGRLDFDTWQGQDGQRRSKHRVFIERFQFLGQAQQQASPQPQASAPQTQAVQAPNPYPEQDPLGQEPDDIPF